MKVLITGGSGKVGNALMQTSPIDYQLVLPDHRALDLEKLDNLRREIRNIAPDILINCASYTAVDKAEKEGELAEQINAQAVGVMAAYCKNKSVLMIQISTDYVFDGGQNNPYTVTDTPNPLGQYGRSKLSGEIAARENCPEVYIVRSSWIYSEHGDNFVKTMLRLAQEGKSMRVVDDQIGSPTCARNLAVFIWQVVEQRPEQKLLHCSDKGSISWYEFAVAIFEEAKSIGLLTEQPDISACSSDEYPTTAQRPAYSVLECAPSFAVLGRSQTDWRVALHNMLVRLHKARAEHAEKSDVKFRRMIRTA